jgi:hypothetical protein
MQEPPKGPNLETTVPEANVSSIVSVNQNIRFRQVRDTRKLEIRVGQGKNFHDDRRTASRIISFQIRSLKNPPSVKAIADPFGY